MQPISDPIRVGRKNNFLTIPVLYVITLGVDGVNGVSHVYRAGRA